MEQAVTAAAGKGPVAAARQGLQQALVLAERYRLNAWQLQMRHAEALLLGSHPEKDVREALEVSCEACVPALSAGQVQEFSFGLQCTPDEFELFPSA